MGYVWLQGACLTVQAEMQEQSLHISYSLGPPEIVFCGAPRRQIERVVDAHSVAIFGDRRCCSEVCRLGWLISGASEVVVETHRIYCCCCTAGMMRGEMLVSSTKRWKEHLKSIAAVWRKDMRENG